VVTSRYVNHLNIGGHQPHVTAEARVVKFCIQIDNVKSQHVDDKSPKGRGQHHVTHFFRATLRKRGVCLPSCVRLSVSHMPGRYRKAECMITRTRPKDSPGTLVFWCLMLKISAKFHRVTLNWSAKHR